MVSEELLRAETNINLAQQQIVNQQQQVQQREADISNAQQQALRQQQLISSEQSVRAGGLANLQQRQQAGSKITEYKGYLGEQTKSLEPVKEDIKSSQAEVNVAKGQVQAAKEDEAAYDLARSVADSSDPRAIFGLSTQFGGSAAAQKYYRQIKNEEKAYKQNIEYFKELGGGSVAKGKEIYIAQQKALNVNIKPVGEVIKSPEIKTPNVSTDKFMSDVNFILDTGSKISDRITTKYPVAVAAGQVTTAVVQSVKSAAKGLGAEVVSASTGGVGKQPYMEKTGTTQKDVNAFWIGSGIAASQFIPGLNVAVDVGFAGYGSYEVGTGVREYQEGNKVGGASRIIGGGLMLVPLAIRGVGALSKVPKKETVTTTSVKSSDIDTIVPPKTNIEPVNPVREVKIDTAALALRKNLGLGTASKFINREIKQPIESTFANIKQKSRFGKNETACKILYKKINL
jgi:hypothetical protein